MKLHPQKQNREAYLKTQIARSDSKFGYCKVSIHDVIRYRNILADDMARDRSEPDLGPAACLGTRNGREVDLFRIGLFGSRPRTALVKLLEKRRFGFQAGLPWLEALGRSRVSALGPRSSIGVELNPRADRRDVWVGSFDDMPAEWTGRFQIVYSNSFDQSQDPYRTAAEWLRITRPGGYLILCFTEDAEPLEHDPVGGLKVEDFEGLFPGRVVYHGHRSSRVGYSEIIINRGLDWAQPPEVD